MLVALRGIIFWGFNVACVFLVCSFGRDYAKRIPKTHKPYAVQRPDFGYERDEQLNQNNNVSLNICN